MRKKRDLQKDNKSIILRLDECKYIGGNYNTSIYLMKNNKVAKIYKDPSECRKEYNLLKKTPTCNFFPRIYNFCGHYIIREYIQGVSIVKYINENKFHHEITLQLIRFLEKLSESNLLHLNIELKDIFITKDNNIILVDIANSDFTENNLNKILKSLKNLNVLEFFLDELKKYNIILYNKWTKLI